MNIADKCGIFGVIDDHNIYHKMINGLKLLQHRGHESAGISYIADNKIRTYKALGFVNNIFENFDENMSISIGHVRYSTRKKTSLENKLLETQPIIGLSRFGPFSLAHNGNIPQIDKLKDKYDITYDTESDTIILIKIIEKLSYKYQCWNDILINIINNIQGVYCLIILFNNQIYALRDSYGVRPLSLGNNTTGYCIASESVALQDYNLLRDIYPGEIVKIDRYNVETIYHRKINKNTFCSFEYIYFMRNDSIIDNKLVQDIRYKLGYQLGLQEQDLNPDAIILSIPNTAVIPAKGFANATNLVYKDYIEKRKDAPRTFILPSNVERIAACNKKFIFHKEIKDHEIYIIDDSIVRGNTLKSILKQIREIGVKKIHLRITSPPVISECYYGIDIPTKRELIAYEKTIENIRKEFNVSSLKYIDIKLMKNIFNQPVCTSCFTGKYNNKLLDW